MFLWIQGTPWLGGVILKLIKLGVDRRHNGAIMKELKSRLECSTHLAFLKLMHLKKQSSHISMVLLGSGTFVFPIQCLRNGLSSL